jgi:hypothetical protein
MKRLSLMQRGYLMGLRRARAKAQVERDALADQFEDVIDDINAEMRSARDELTRLRTLTLDHFDTLDSEKPRWLN